MTGLQRIGDMKLLVTGGAGFIGSNFIRHILTTERDVSVVNFDKLTYAGNLENLRDIEKNPRYTFVKGDITDAEAVDAAMQGVDAVANYAAETHVDRSIMDPKAFLATDVIGTWTLLEAVQRHNIPRMVQISTDEVFGEIMEGEADENSSFRPRSPYAAAKAGGDHLCAAFWETYKTPVIVTHACNIYGPYQYPEKFFSLAITNLLEGKRVPLYGDGSQVREWMDVSDHCRAIAEVLKRGKPGEVYNIGTGERLTNRKALAEVLRMMGKDESFMESVTDRPGHDRRYALSHKKITSELGWEPSNKFAEGIRETVEWYRDHESWWRPLKSGEYLEYYKKQYKL